MLKNYFKIAWRNILKNRGLFSINIIGLSLGIASCLVITLYVADELSFDRYHEKANDIVRVVFKAKVNGEDIKEAVVMAPVAQAFQQEFPEILAATRLRNGGSPKITYNTATFRNGRFAYVDPNFFKVFTLPIIEGNKISPLEEPNTIVLTQEEAKKYFGNENPIGKILDFKDQGERFRVTAIMENIPQNSHFHFDMLASMVGNEEAKNASWMESGFFTYLLLKNDYNYKNLEVKLPAITEKYMGPQIKEAMGISFDEFTKSNKIGLLLQPLTDIHLKSDFSDNSTLEPGGDIKSVYIFWAIALFMLLIACINFVNLSTAAATKRMKEVGIRKVLGSNVQQLISQFLMESFIASVFAMLFAIVIVILILPLFNDLSGKELHLANLYAPEVFLGLLLLVFLITFLAGGYPAFYLSSFKPVAILKNKFVGSKGGKGIRNGLVVFQFVISAGLILTTLIVDQQIRYIQNKDLGYNKEQILVLRDADLLGLSQESFKNQIVSDPRVALVSNSGFLPAGASNNSMSGILINDKSPRRMVVYDIDDEYIPTLDMKILKGRNFSKEYGSDSLNVILNETAAKILGLGEDPIDKIIIRATDNQGSRQHLTVIGLVKDFHFRSLHQTIDPLIMLYQPNGGFIVKAKSADMAALIERISRIWNSYGIDEPFDYSLLDESYNKTYLVEQKMGTILRIFALLTIFVACLGLFGLVTFTVQQRFKEIGVRKVLGSTVPQIVGMLTMDVLKLVMIAMAIAFSLGYYLMNKWLQDFAYRIDIVWWVFVVAAFITVFIAFVTISYRSIKAALVNPVESLRSE